MLLLDSILETAKVMKVSEPLQPEYESVLNTVIKKNKDQARVNPTRRFLNKKRPFNFQQFQKTFDH
jgi:hypothetical protein